MDNLELYKKHRPKKISEVVGQDDAVAVLKDMVRRNAVPHTLLFTGPSGCGKTTLARILKNKLKCADSDFQELNAAKERGIDMVREIEKRCGLAALGGGSRMWLVDESHQLTAAAQDAFLKLLEDTPRHVYFVLCTTDPQKLKKTIRTRCTEIKVKELSDTAAEKLIQTVTAREDVTLESDVIDALVEMGQGSARQLLVLLHSIIGMKDPEDQLAALKNSNFEAQAIELARTLIRANSSFSDAAKILKNLDDDAEQVRWLVLSFCRTVLLSGGRQSGRAWKIIDIFRQNFYDSKHAGLAAACYEVYVDE